MNEDTPMPPASPAAQVAMQQEIIDLLGQKLDWRIRAIDLQRQVDDLTKQLADTAPDARKEG